MENSLLDLIQGADIEWKPLGEILIKTKGTKITAKQMKELDKSDGSIKIFAGGKTVAFVNYGDIPEKDILIEPSIIVKSRGIIEFEYYDKPFSHKSEMWSYHSEDKNINIKYVYYYLKMNEKYFQNLGSKMQMPQIATPDTERYKIPIPSLEIQQKVVEILDKMTDYVTQLTTELTTELTLRQKQYAYYRDKLLTFPSQSDSDESLPIKYMTLGEIGEVRMCKRILKNQTSSTGDVPFFKIGTFGKKPNAFISRELFEEYKEKYSYPKVGDLLISASGTIGRIVKFDGEDAYFQDSNIVWIDNDETQVRNDYLRYYYQIANWGTSQGGTITRLYNDGLKKMKIAVPPLELQDKIVEILEKFDKLTSDLSEGLPREIELRQKQYEYWREQLLSFKKE